MNIYIYIDCRKFCVHKSKSNMLKRTVKLLMLFATINFVGIGCSLRSGSVNESDKNNILPYHISKLIKSNEYTTINQKGIVVF